MQTESFICLSLIQIQVAIHVESRGPTFNQSTPPLPSSYIKSRRCFLQQKGATTTTAGNILFLYLIFEAVEISCCWKNREQYYEEREKEKWGLSDRHPWHFCPSPVFLLHFPKNQSKRSISKILSSIMLLVSQLRAISKCIYSPL